MRYYCPDCGSADTYTDLSLKFSKCIDCSFIVDLYDPVLELINELYDDHFDDDHHDSDFVYEPSFNSLQQAKDNFIYASQRLDVPFFDSPIPPSFDDIPF